MKQTSRGLAPSLNTGHITFTGARQRLAVALVAIFIAFAGAQTAWAQTLCNVRFDISSGGTVELQREGQWLEVTNGQTIPCLIPSVSALTLTPETDYVVSSITCDAQDGLLIDLFPYDDHWDLNIHPYGGSETPTITVRIVFDKGLAGGADEASAVALTADNDLSHLAGGWYKVESDLTLGHTVNLHGDTHIIIASGATLTVNTSGEYGISGSALTVSGEGTLNVSANDRAIYVDNYTQTGCAVTLSGSSYGLHATNNVSISGGSLTTSGATYGIKTDKGSITISGGTVSSSGDSAGLFATSAMNITGGTVSASGNNYGIIGYSVSITGGQVTASSGGILSIVGDITLGWTSATDYITASGYVLQKDGKHVKIADGQTLYGGGFPSASYNGTIGDPSALNGLMLRPTAAVTESGTNEYTIRYADGWDAFCDRLAADDGKDFFSGKTVKLADDITVSRMAGSSDKPFTGTFNGQEHTLTVSYSGSSYVAPFSYVDGATIQNLVVEGTISSSGTRAAGVIGETGSPGTTGKSYITNCVSSSTITGGNYSGGFSIGGNVEIEGCVFNGIINSEGNSGGFVGYSQSALTITNSLFAPQSGSSAKGTFYYNGTAGTLTNCYYTQTLGEGQGKQAHSIAAGEGVTLGHAGAATEYSVSGITAYKASGASGDSDPFIAGIIYNNVLYAGSGDAVSLTLANSSGDAPLGYKNGDYSVNGGATLSGTTLTMADDNVTVSFTPGALRSTGQAVLVSYIDAYGILCDGQDGRPDPASAIALDGTETDLGQYGEETWYFVGADISHSGTIDCYSNVNIILADGYTMTVNNNNGIDGAVGSNDILTIYGQTFGTGTLDITATNYGIYYDIVVIRGGTVNATGTNGYGIFAVGDVTITGGQVTVTGNSLGIFAGGDITLGCTNASDFIKATSYCPGGDGGVNIADYQTLYDEDGKEYSGDGVGFDELAGKTLRPYDCRLALRDNADNTTDIAAANGKVYNVTLQGRTLYKDGAWNTLCLPFALGDDRAESGHELDGTPLEGATLMTLGNSQACNTGFDPQTGTLNLEFLPATTVEPGVAYIVKWPIPDGMTADEFAAAYAANPDAYDLKNPVFTGVTVTNDAPADHATTSLDGYVTFVGTYDPAAIYADPAVNLYLGAANKLYWPSTEGYRLGTFRAYFALGNGLTCGDPSNPNAARQFVLNFDGDGEQTQGITTTDYTDFTDKAGAWYTIDGVKLDGKPTKKGLYIHGDRKVVIP